MKRAPLRSRVRRGLAEPHLVVREANRWYHRLADVVTRHHRRGVDFFAEDWDTLVLLDACRYDTFAARADLPGTLESRWSRSSATREFLHYYLDGADLRDTVYVTGNPQLYRRRDEVEVAFHEVRHVWRDEGWDDEARTVHPETMARAAEAAHADHPDKRLLVHFMQPHYPFIGETGRAHLDQDSLDFGDGVIAGHVDVDRELLRRAYAENLDVALPSVRRLLGSLGGRTVVSADHGELLGERAFPLPMREYGHPAGVRCEALNRVPWLVHENGPRRETTAGDAADDRDAGGGRDGPTGRDADRAAGAGDGGAGDGTGGVNDGPTDDLVEERLRQLGYR